MVSRKLAAIFFIFKQLGYFLNQESLCDFEFSWFVSISVLRQNTLSCETLVSEENLCAFRNQQIVLSESWMDATYCRYLNIQSFLWASGRNFTEHLSKLFIISKLQKERIQFSINSLSELRIVYFGIARMYTGCYFQ